MEKKFSQINETKQKRLDRIAKQVTAQGNTLSTKVHSVKKDYNRSKNKQNLRNIIEKDFFEESI